MRREAARTAPRSAGRRAWLGTAVRLMARSWPCCLDGLTRRASAARTPPPAATPPGTTTAPPPAPPRPPPRFPLLHRGSPPLLPPSCRLAQPPRSPPRRGGAGQRPRAPSDQTFRAPRGCPRVRRGARWRGAPSLCGRGTRRTAGRARSWRGGGPGNDAPRTIRRIKKKSERERVMRACNESVRGDRTTTMVWERWTRDTQFFACVRFLIVFFLFIFHTVSTTAGSTSCAHV